MTRINYDVKPVGYVVHYEGSFNAGAFFESYKNMKTVERAMKQNRSDLVVCVTPVFEVPEWVEN